MQWVPTAKKGRPSKEGRQKATPRLRNRLHLAVLFGVMTAGLGMMLFGVAGVAMRAVGVVCGLLVVAGFVMLGGFAVMLGRVLVMFGRLVVMFDCLVAHVSLPAGELRVCILYANPLTLC